jgi:hypothetical protein
MIDDLLLQEIQSLREKLKIAVHILEFYCPDLNEPKFMHDIGTCDYQDYLEQLMEDEENE